MSSCSTRIGNSNRFTYYSDLLSLAVLVLEHRSGWVDRTHLACFTTSRRALHLIDFTTWAPSSRSSVVITCGWRPPCCVASTSHWWSLFIIFIICADAALSNIWPMGYRDNLEFKINYVVHLDNFFTIQSLWFVSDSEREHIQELDCYSEMVQVAISEGREPIGGANHGCVEDWRGSVDVWTLKRPVGRTRRKESCVKNMKSLILLTLVIAHCGEHQQIQGGWQLCTRSLHPIKERKISKQGSKCENQRP